MESISRHLNESHIDYRYLKQWCSINFFISDPKFSVKFGHDPYIRLFTLPYRVWSSIVIVHEKKCFFPSFFRNISKAAETILIK